MSFVLNVIFPVLYILATKTITAQFAFEVLHFSNEFYFVNLILSSRCVWFCTFVLFI